MIHLASKGWKIDKKYDFLSSKADLLWKSAKKKVFAHNCEIIYTNTQAIFFHLNLTSIQNLSGHKWGLLFILEILWRISIRPFSKFCDFVQKKSGLGC